MPLPVLYNALMPRTVTDSIRLQIATLCKEGKTYAEIATLLKFSPQTIRSHAIQLGFAPQAPDPAVIANRTARIAAKRAALAERALEEAEWFLDSLRKPTMVFAFGGKENEYNEHLLPSGPPIPDKRNLMQAYSIAVKSHIELERIDTDEGAEARSMLSELADALGMEPREGSPNS